MSVGRRLMVWVYSRRVGKKEKAKAAARAAKAQGILAGSTLSRSGPRVMGIALGAAQGQAPVPLAVGDVATVIRDALRAAARLADAGEMAQAEARCRAVTEQFPNDGSAWNLLGVIQRRRGKLLDASRAFEAATKYSPKDLSAWHNLGLALSDSTPDRAIEAFSGALGLQPDDELARTQRAMLLTNAGRLDEAEQDLNVLRARAPHSLEVVELEAMVLGRRGEHAAAVGRLTALYERTPARADAQKKLSSAYRRWFRATPEGPVQREVLEKWLTFEPDNPAALAAKMRLAGAEMPPEVPGSYVARHFDGFADTFDQVLTSLGYQGPEVLRGLLERLVPRTAQHIVDLGCGTGRMGPVLGPWKERLVGVDLSEKMIDRARPAGLYSEFHVADLASFLSRTTSSFGLAVCADTLVYIGQLNELFKLLAARMPAGGFFLGTVEASDGEPVRLHEAGRYAHSRPYLTEALSAAGFGDLVIEDFVVRREEGVDVLGLAFCARRSS
jgi:predicted TPR repeat methyltransferase/cytochrome c-type biogenesis protein CcmH/NrfG